jgi:hypothetical protein
VLHGNIEDIESLRRGASDFDGVIHLAFNHYFSQFQKNADDDRKAIVEAYARGLKAPAVSIKPEEAEAHFGWLARFAGLDMPSSSALTQQKLN